MYFNLETNRLYLRPLAVSDAIFMKELLNTEGWLKNIGDRNIHTIADAEAYILKINENKHYFYHVSLLKETNIPIGVVTFMHRAQYHWPDIGFALLPLYAKQGYSYEAANAYLNEIKKQKSITTVLGFTLQDNIASIRLLEKLGLRFVHFFEEAGESLSLYRL